MKHILAQIEADARYVAMHQTFGHLGPSEGVHQVEIIFAWSIYGDVLIIEDKHPTLENSPWQFESFNDMVWELCNPNALDEKDRLEQGKVYRFKGTVTWGKVENDRSGFGEALGVTNWEGETEVIF